MAWVTSHWQQLAVAVLALAELISLFVPGASGTLSGLISALGALPGVKDPEIGAK